MTDPVTTFPPLPRHSYAESAATEVENEASRFEFNIGAERFSLPPHIDPRILAAAQTGRVGIAIKLMMGDEFDRFLLADAPFTQDDLLDLLNRWAAWAGTTLGE